jgi:predicted CopG family antitoxin
VHEIRSAFRANSTIEDHAMAVKTITVDMEAYELLAAEKHGKESFSKVIKRRFQPERTARALLTGLDQVVLSEETLDSVEEVVGRRGESIAESPIIVLES